MKKLLSIILITFALSRISFSQNVNWRSLNEGQNNIVQFNFGYEFGVVGQLSYNHSIEIIKPVLLELAFSIPMGNNELDDFKIQYGGRIEVFEHQNFSISIGVLSNFRRYQNEFVRIVSFGCDFSAVFGFYQPTWHLAGEFGFDKSIISNLEHSNLMKENYPQIKDGWYLPSGGHYYYGFQASKTLSDFLSIAVRVGATRAQQQDEEAAIPAYIQLGLGMRF